MLTDYKVKTPFRYPGRKYYALKYLLPYIKRIPHDEYREPFIGGGSVFFGKPKAKTSWINDIDSELINVYKVIQNDRKNKELIKLLEKEVATPERHAEVKEFCPSSEIERAFKYYYLNRTSYSGIMKKPAWGYCDGKSSPPKNWGAMILNAQKKLQGVQITQGDFTDQLLSPSKQRVLLYLDPPYFEADQKRAYQNHFTMKDHVRLSDALKKTKHYFFLSYDNIPDAKKFYEWANFIELSWNYNTSNLKSQKRQKGQELLITNIPISTIKVEIGYTLPLLV